MIKITLCLLVISTAVLGQQRFTTAEEYQAHIRTQPYFFHGTWHVINPITPRNLYEATTFCTPTGIVTFREGDKTNEYTLGMYGTDVIGRGCANPLNTNLPFPNASSFDQAAAMKTVSSGNGMNYEISSLNVTMDTVEGAFHVKFTFGAVGAGKSTWTFITLSKRVSIESLVDVYPVSNTSPGFFLGNWTVTAPYSHNPLSDQACCVPQGKVFIWGNSTISPYKIYMNATSFVGKSCDGVEIGSKYSIDAPITLAIPFPAISSFEAIAKKDWSYNFRNLAFKVSNLNVNNTFADKTVHESFSMTFGFLNGKAYADSSCSVTLQRRVAVYDKDILQGIKGTFLEK